jgi:hypothetical protein
MDSGLAGNEAIRAIICREWAHPAGLGNILQPGRETACQNPLVRAGQRQNGEWRAHLTLAKIFRQHKIGTDSFRRAEAIG